MKLVIYLSSVLVLGGCISTSPESWTHAPDEQTEVKRVIFECKSHANAISYQHTAYGGAVMPLIGLGARRSAFNECMGAHGYAQ